MKLPFISRKKYEIMKKNYSVAMEGQSDLRKKYIESQERANKLCELVEVSDYDIKDLKKEVKRLKQLLTKNGINYKKEEK